MTPAQVGLAYVVQLALLVTLVGLVARRRVHLCWSFALYLATVLATDFLYVTWPKLFWTAAFWAQKEAVLGALKLCIAVELAANVFRAFPAARLRAARVGAVVSFVTMIFMMRLPDELTVHHLVFGYQPQVATGTIWLLACTVALASWYCLPLHALHRAILTGLTTYLGVFTMGVEWARARGFYSYDSPGARQALGYLFAGAYLLTVLWFGRAAWRKPEAEVLEFSPLLLSRLRLDTA